MNLDDEQKKLVKDAIQEWLDSKWIAVGKWSVAGIAAAVLAAVFYIIVWAHGLPMK